MGYAVYLLAALAATVGSVELASSQTLSGRWTGELTLQTTEQQLSPLSLDLETRLALDLSFDGLDLRSALRLTGRGLTEVRFGWEAAFPAGFPSLEVENDLVWAAGTAEPPGFRAMYLNSALEFLDFELKNDLALIAAGSGRAKGLDLEDVLVIEGETPAGVEVELSSEFGGERGSIEFRRESLSVDGPAALGATWEGTVDLDGNGFAGLEIGADYAVSITALSAEVELEAAIRLDRDLKLSPDEIELDLTTSTGVEGELRIDSEYGSQTFDADDDGREENLFALERRQIELEVEPGDGWEVEAALTFEPVLEDVDEDGALERTAPGRLAEAQLRLKRAWEGRSQGWIKLLWEPPPGGEAPPTLFAVRLRLRTALGPLELLSTTSVDLREGEFEQELETELGF